jgi:hypothetical protein
MISSFIVLVFVVIQFYNLFGKPSAAFSTEVSFQPIEFYSPELITEEYS